MADQLSREQRVLIALKSASERIRQLEDSQSQAIAVCGLALRFPGKANQARAYWTLMKDGRLGVCEVPADRWDIAAYYDPDVGAPGKMTTRFGGFLAGVDVSGFDAAFFGIAAKEAQTMDPQQRLLLECVWEALEDAGYSPATLGGSRTGVFLGICTNDYGDLLAQAGADNIDPYRGTGNARSAAAGRISYAFGFQGPSMAVDTACSSSLYALHHAVSALRNDECDLAVVAGVNLLLSPGPTIYLSNGRFMAPDGRCKTFDASANGYVRGEGCGVLILKRQRDAETDGDRIRALVRGTAVNQDGRSGGLTVPNGPAQERVIRDALERASVKPSEVDYVEAHGTGTQLGDPIEVNALANVYGEGRAASKPLLIGSVKTNIGHLEAAAGMAGLIKLILSMEHEEIPGQLHLKTPNQKIGWGDMPVSVVSRAVEWKRGNKKRLAGVSGFAFQGSNAHIIIEEAPQTRTSESSSSRALLARPVELLCLSAKSAEALRLQVESWVGYLGTTEDDLREIAYSALEHRSHFEWRLALVAKDCKEAAEKLGAYLAGKGPLGLWVTPSGPEGKDGAQVVSLQPLKAMNADALNSASAWQAALGQLGSGYAMDKAEIKDAVLLKESGGRRVDIPTYSFLRQRYWFEGSERPQSAGTQSSGYEFLGSEVELPTEADKRVFITEVSEQWPVWLKDHRVQGEVVMPGAGFVELMLQAGRSVLGGRWLELREVEIERALIVKGAQQLQVVVTGAEGSAYRSVEVHGRPKASGGQWAVYARGRVGVGASAPRATTIIEELRGELLAGEQETTPAEAMAGVYAGFLQAGLNYGEQFQTVEGASSRPGPRAEVLSQVRVSRGKERFELSPMVLDGCLQSLALGMGGGASGDVYLPLGFGQVVIGEAVSGSERIDCHGLSIEGQVGQDETVKWDLELFASDGQVVAEIRGATFKRARTDAIAKQVAASAVDGYLYELEWQALTRSKQEPDHKPEQQRWLVVHEAAEEGAAQGYAAALRGRGLDAEVIGPTDLMKKVARVDSASATTALSTGIVWVVARADEAGDKKSRLTVAKRLHQQLERVLKPLLGSVQELIKGGVKTRLVVVTEGAQPVGDLAVKRPWQSSVWGMVRVMANEHPELSAKLIDVSDYLGSAEELSLELCADGDEDEVGLYQGQRYGHRLVRQRRQALRVPTAENYALQVRQRGQLDQLELKAVDRSQTVPDGCVQVCVEAVGLNFRDVLNALGMYPGDAGELGGDFAGVVEKVGSKVSQFKQGDRVYGMASGALRRYVVTDARLVTKTPSTLSDSAASTLISTFLTAKYALEDEAKLQAKERVLIHSAAGGVGQAAVQVAKRLGAEIYATASVSKHEYLRAQGITHVYDSRSEAFFEQILADTQGRGVDVVLNSLTKGKLEKSLKLLGAGGRFIEIGKAQLLSEEQARSLNDKARYMTVALDDLSVSRPEWFEGAYADLNEQLQSRVYRPLKYEEQPISRAVEVFRRLAQGQNVGKVVLRMAAGDIKHKVSGEGSYVISGGIGAIGREVGVWLAEQGAKDIVLLSRSAPGKEAEGAIERMKAKGAVVTTEEVDVSDEKALKVVLERARARQGKEGRIAGVMHAAGVLEDSTIQEQSWEKFEKVLQAKVIGAEVLRSLAPEAEYFGCFGSISAVIGNPGQANYAAANAYLDGFAESDATGRTQTIDWWAWSGAGMAAEPKGEGERVVSTMP